MAITYFGSASTPADNSTSTATQHTITPPASMTAGMLVTVYQQQRGTATFSIGVTGGQTWKPILRITGTNIAVAGWYCTFNGTWAASPRFDFSAGTCTTTVMHVFQPSSTNHVFYQDLQPINGTFAAGSSPFTKTITGLTTLRASTVTIAAWFSADDNTWGTLSGAGWSKAGMSAQYRNASGSQQSSTYAYYIQTSAGATGNVSQNQATNGGDAGVTYMASFFETTEKILGNPTIMNTDFSVTSGNFLACAFQAQSNGTTVDLNAYVRGDTGTVNFYAALFQVNMLDYSLIGMAGPLSQGTSYATKTFSFAQPLTSGVYYCIAVWGDANWQFKYSNDANLAFANQTFSFPMASTSPVAFPTNVLIALATHFTTVESWWLTFTNGYTMTASGGSYSLSGHSAALKSGKKILANNGSYNLNGQSANLKKGLNIPIVRGNYSLSGQSAGLLYNRRVSISQGSYSLFGQSVVFNKGSTISANSGTYNITGYSVNMPVNKVVQAIQGQYNVNGQVAALKKGSILTANSGYYLLNGEQVLLKKGNTISVSKGQYNLAGQSVSLRKGANISIAHGSYNLSGQDTTFYKYLVMQVVQGSYNLNGQNSGLLYGNIMSAEQGSYMLNGQNAALVSGKRVSITTGMYNISGYDVAFLRNRIMSSSSGYYSYTGFDVNLILGRSILKPTYLVNYLCSLSQYSIDFTFVKSMHQLNYECGMSEFDSNYVFSKGNSEVNYIFGKENKIADSE